MSSGIEEALSNSEFSGFLESGYCDNAAAQEELLQRAREFAVVPISGFKVGALAMGQSGKCYLGANMEFAGVPLHASLHAEQSAVLNAWMHGEASITQLIVSETPCGHCRQFLLELHGAAELEIIAKGSSRKLADLMPEPFTRPCAKGQGLLDSPRQNLIFARASDDNTGQRAINAASRSYTPYSQSPEGFIIETLNGKHFAGRTAESIAFNPSVPAAITALNQMNLSSQRNDTITRCTHSRLATGLTHTLTFSEALMRVICNEPVESVLMETAD